MKKILSISVGSPSRDHTTQVEFLGQLCELSRQGTNGDFDLAVQRYKEMDGKVDAFGVGGAEFFLEVGKRKYHFRDIKRIRNAIKISKVGDGNGIKGILAQRKDDVTDDARRQPPASPVHQPVEHTNAQNGGHQQPNDGE